MKRWLAACMVFFAIPAAACVPPPGLSRQQWYSMCGKDMEYGYSLGGANRPPHDVFMRQMYQMYRNTRAPYNPVMDQMQRNTANTLARDHQRFMNDFNQQGADRTAAFQRQQRVNAGQHEDEMDYIRDQRTVCDNTGRCYKVSN